MEAEGNADNGNEDKGNADEGNEDEMYLNFFCNSSLICLIHLVQQAK